jgi:tetratricopeptide (TPR) repeat protein
VRSTKLVVLALGALGLAGALTAAALVAPSRAVDAAKTYVPRDPSVVVAHVQQRDPEMRAVPETPDAAVALAERDVERGLALEDPTYFGHARELLATAWALPAPPPGVRLVRAKAELGVHDFAAARRDLDALVAVWPDNAQVQLARAHVAAGAGDDAAARTSCEAVRAASVLAAVTCTAQLDGLADPVHAAIAINNALAAEPDSDPALRASARAAIGGLAVQQGERKAAAAEYAEALQLAPDDHAIRAALADVEAPAEASGLLAGYEAIDSLLVRRAIAEHAVRGPDDAKLVQTVHDRVATAIARGDHTQLAVMARFALAVDGDRAAALPLARAAWAERHDLPAARVMVLAGDAAPVRAWQNANEVIDAQLERTP